MFNWCKRIEQKGRFPSVSSGIPHSTPRSLMKGMNRLLAFTTMAKAVTGLALIVAPSLVGRLLLGVELAGVAVVVARVAGIALIALGAACWPGRTARTALLTAGMK